MGYRYTGGQVALKDPAMIWDLQKFEVREFAISAIPADIQPAFTPDGGILRYVRYAKGGGMEFVSRDWRGEKERIVPSLLAGKDEITALYSDDGMSLAVLVRKRLTLLRWNDGSLSEPSTARNSLPGETINFAQRSRWNFSPWCDFRSYNDDSLARTLGSIRDAIREGDPGALGGVEGTQMPSAWGGYDLWKLSRVLDWVEPYDIANAREIFGSFMPGKPIMTTVGEKDAREARRRLWHLLLQGDRGCIVWWSEDCIEFREGRPALTARAQALAPVLKEMTSPLAALFLKAKRELDRIAIHYSQPSIQVDWLIESTPDGRTWPRRFSSFEATHNKMAAARNGWVKALQDLGFSPRFVSSEQIERGELDFQALVLPGSLAMSDQELETLRRSGRTLLADGPPGVFDHHGRLRAAAPELPVQIVDGAAEYAKARQTNRGAAFVGQIRDQLSKQPALAAKLDSAARLAMYRYRLGDAWLVALERNIDYKMGEDLKQSADNAGLEEPVSVQVKLPEAGHVYDLRTGSYIGEVATVAAQINPWEPSLYVITSEKLEGDIVTALHARK